MLHPNDQQSVMDELLWYDGRAVMQDARSALLSILRLVQEYYAGQAQHDAVQRLQQNIINPATEGEYEIAWLALAEMIESRTEIPSPMRHAEQILTALATYCEYYNLP